MSSAIGIVRPTVTMPHGLSPSALTTISASTAISTIMMPSTATSAVKPGDGPDLLLRHLAERLAVAADRRAEDDEVLDGAAERHADDDPDGAGQEAELRGERRTDQRAGAGDGREVVTEHDPAVGRHEVAAVVEPLGRRRASGVEREDLGRDDPAVEPVGDEVRADGRGEEPGGADLFAASKGHDAEGAGTGEGNEDPDQDAQRFWHNGIQDSAGC